MHVRPHQREKKPHLPEWHASYDSAQRQMKITITFVGKHTKGSREGVKKKGEKPTFSYNQAYSI
jgi:hypothetical protein